LEACLVRSIPTTLGKVAHYAPTLPEVMISVAVWAIGALIVTALYRIALATRGENSPGWLKPN
jgi:molybdopterin-containing oxidoreductase family membrane subunit